VMWGGRARFRPGFYTFLPVACVCFIGLASTMPDKWPDDAYDYARGHMCVCVRVCMFGCVYHWNLTTGGWGGGASCDLSIT